MEKLPVHPEIQKAANRLKRAYKCLKYAQTEEKRDAAKNKVVGQLLEASIIAQYIQRSSAMRS